MILVNNKWLFLITIFSLGWLPQKEESKALSSEKNPKLKEILKGISKNDLRNCVRSLVDFETRYAPSDQAPKVESWIYQQFKTSGYANEHQLQYQPFDHLGVRRNNVIARTGPKGDSIIILGAHFDSIRDPLSASHQAAPGADDNASGTAVLLEMARIFKELPLKKELVFMAFQWEELFLKGSQHAAAQARNEQWPIELYINLDMIGYSLSKPSESKVWIEYDMGNQVPDNDLSSKKAAQFLEKVTTGNTTFGYECRNISSSDYISFEKEGFVCVGLSEFEENPNRHTVNDTLETINFDYLEEVARLTASALFELAVDKEKL